jgi:hypothetical protein
MQLEVLFPRRTQPKGTSPRLFSVLVGSNAASANCSMLFCAGVLRIPYETMEVIGRIPASPTQLTGFFDAAPPCSCSNARAWEKRLGQGLSTQGIVLGGLLILDSFLCWVSALAAGFLPCLMFTLLLEFVTLSTVAAAVWAVPFLLSAKNTQETTTARVTAHRPRTTRLPPHKDQSSSCRAAFMHAVYSRTLSW